MAFGYFFLRATGKAHPINNTFADDNCDSFTQRREKKLRQAKEENSYGRERETTIKKNEKKKVSEGLPRQSSTFDAAWRKTIHSSRVSRGRCADFWFSKYAPKVLTNSII